MVDDPLKERKIVHQVCHLVFFVFSDAFIGCVN